MTDDERAERFAEIDRDLDRSGKLLTLSLWLFLVPLALIAAVFVAVLVWLL